MESGFTAVESARVIEGLRWSSLRLFEILGEWASAAQRSDIAVSLATASRHMGWHAEDLTALVPDSVLIDGDPSPAIGYRRLGAALERLRAGSDSIENLAIAHRVLLTRIGSRCVAIEKLAASHSDAALLRVIGFMLTDLRRDRDEGEALLQQLLSSQEIVRSVGSSVVEAESLIVVAGGLPPSTDMT